MDASEEDSGRRSDTWRHPSSSGWWWLVSFVFPTRPSCREIARANGYPAAWAGWAVSVSELPLTGRGAGVPLPARGSSPPLVRHSLLDQTLVRLPKLILGPSAHVFVKPSFSRNPPQYSGLENSMDRGARGLQSTASQSPTRQSTHAHTHTLSVSSSRVPLPLPVSARVLAPLTSASAVRSSSA